MIINNLTKKPIKDISFGGFFFSIPVGITACWDKFGEFLLKDIYPQGDGSNSGGGVPPVVRALPSDWNGERYVEVRRFPINHELIPARKDLLKIAKQRGIDKLTIEQWEEDDTVENKTIVDAINDLDVPDNVKYPKVEDAPADEETEKSNKAAEDALKDLGGDDTTKKPAETKAPAAPARTAPKTGQAVGAKNGAKKKAAPKTPKTPASKK